MGAFDKTTFTDHGGVRVLHVPIELDVYTVPDFRSTGVDAVNDGRYDLLVDLSQTTFIDSTGWGVLVGMRNRVGRHGGTMRLAGPISAGVNSGLKITGLAKVFEIVDSVEAAIGARGEG